MADSDYTKFSWRQVAPHRWERAIDEAETFYHCLAKQWAGSGRMFFAMTGHASISVVVDRDEDATKMGTRLETALQQAWMKLRKHYPNIASWVEYDAESQSLRKVYETPQDGNDMQSWLTGTFKIVRTPLRGPDWANDDPPAPKMPTLFVIDTRIPDQPHEGTKSCSPGNKSEEKCIERSIVFRSPHEIIDGVGTLQLLGNLFAHAAEAFDQPSKDVALDFGDEHANLSPPMRVAANIAPSLTPAQEQRLAETQTYNASLSNDIPPATLPFIHGSVVPGVHKRVALTLTESATKALLATCKNNNITPTHAYHAAIALTLRDLQPGANDPTKVGLVRYISYALINHRRDCVPPYNSAAHPASVIHSVSGRSLVLDMPLTSPKATTSGSDFVEIIHQVREFYAAIKDDKTHLAFTPAYFARGTPKLSHELLGSKDPPKEIPPPDTNPSVSISSMGKIDDLIAPTYGRLTISGGSRDGNEPWVTGEELRRGFGMFLGTWRDRITLSLAYNDAWHNDTEARAFLDKVNAVVGRGLDELNQQA